MRVLGKIDNGMKRGREMSVRKIFCTMQTIEKRESKVSKNGGVVINENGSIGYLRSDCLT